MRVRRFFTTLVRNRHGGINDRKLALAATELLSTCLSGSSALKSGRGSVKADLKRLMSERGETLARTTTPAESTALAFVASIVGECWRTKNKTGHKLRATTTSILSSWSIPNSTGGQAARLAPVAN
jgi:hypothetical protein